jgi:ammonia channel protein AmtB
MINGNRNFNFTRYRRFYHYYYFFFFLIFISIAHANVAKAIITETRVVKLVVLVVLRTPVVHAVVGRQSRGVVTADVTVADP